MATTEENNGEAMVGSDGAEGRPERADENDPCLKTNSKNNNRSRNVDGFRQRTEEKLRAKTGLSRNGLWISAGVVCTLFVLFLVVIVLAACWPRTPHERQFPVCENAACLRAISQIHEGLNKSISPCDDVAAWGCAKWQKNNPLPPDHNHWSRRVQLHQNDAAQMRALITTLPYPLDPKSVKWKVKHLYDACMQMDNVDADGFRLLHRYINTLGGWSVLREWSEFQWDYRHILQQLQAKYKVSPFVKISVVPNPRSPSTNIIKIAPSGLGLPDKSFYYLDLNNKIVKAYKHFIRDVVIIFKATSSDANNFSNDMFHFEKRLAEITPDTTTIQDPLTTNNIVTVAELKLTAPSLPLQAILEGMYPKGKISDDTEILVVSLDYLTAVSELLSTTDRSALNNYFMWTFTREYIPYLSTDLLAELHEYETELTGVQRPLDRWELCVGFVRKFIGLATESMLQKSRHLTDIDRKVIEEIFENIRIAAKAIVEDFDYPQELEKHLKTKLNSMSLQVGLPDHTMTDGYLQDVYQTLFVQRGNLFTSVLNGYDFLKIEEQQRYNEPKSEDRLIPFLIQPHPVVSFSLTANTLIVPSLYLSEPMFHSKYPKSVLFGRLGLEMAKAVASTILPYGSSWTAHIGLLSLYHPAYNESMESIQEPMKCISSRINEHQLARDHFNLTSLNAIIHLYSVIIAHRALEVSLLDNEHIHQPTLESYEDSMLFYLTYIQEQCSYYAQQYEFLENNVYYKLTDMQQLKVTWTQVDSFAKALECPSNGNKQCL